MTLPGPDALSPPAKIPSTEVSRVTGSYFETSAFNINPDVLRQIDIYHLSYSYYYLIGINCNGIVFIICRVKLAVESNTEIHCFNSIPVTDPLPSICFGPHPFRITIPSSKVDSISSLYAGISFAVRAKRVLLF